MTTYMAVLFEVMVDKFFIVEIVEIEKPKDRCVEDGVEAVLYGDCVWGQPQNRVLEVPVRQDMRIQNSAHQTGAEAEMYLC